ncbi:histidine kinase, partial [bacterium]|nr:histidine kinase [bacterium]
GFLKLSDAGLISKINFTGSGLLGEERGALMDRRFANFIAESDRARWHQFFVGLLQQEESRTCELAVKRRDGSEI